MAGAQIEKWPTSGRIGSITSAVVGVPNASERGAKSEVGWPGVGGCAHGGATTNGPDATHPLSHLSKLGGRRGGRGSWGGRVGEGIGGTAGGVPKRGGGAARDQLLPHVCLEGGCVSGGMGSRTRAKPAVSPSKGAEQGPNTQYPLQSITLYCYSISLLCTVALYR